MIDSLARVSPLVQVEMGRRPHQWQWEGAFFKTIMKA
jgi:hypothetical protein